MFEMNAEAHPEVPRAHGALADTYSAAGRMGDARRSYLWAIALAEEQDDSRLPRYRARLDWVTEQLEKER